MVALHWMIRLRQIIVMIQIGVQIGVQIGAQIRCRSIVIRSIFRLHSQRFIKHTFRWFRICTMSLWCFDLRCQRFSILFFFLEFLIC
eukprot:UN27742